MSYFDDVIEPKLYKTPKQQPLTILNPSVQVWFGKDGEQTLIGDMADSHLRNAYSLLGRRMSTPEEKPSDVIYYGILRSELNKRKLIP